MQIAPPAIIKELIHELANINPFPLLASIIVLSKANIENFKAMKIEVLITIVPNRTAKKL